MFRKKYSLKTQMILVLMISFLVLTAVMTSFYYQYSTKKVRQETEQFFMEKVNHVSEQLDEVINKMDSISGQIFSSQLLQRLFLQASSEEYAEKNYFEYHITDRNQAQDVLWSFNSPKRQTASINVFTGSSYVGLRYSPSAEKIRKIASQEKWQIPEGKYYHVLGPHEDEWETLLPKKVISLIRVMEATSYNFAEVGMIEVQENYNTIEDICALDSEDLALLVVDEDQNVIYQSREYTEEQRSVLYQRTMEYEPNTLLSIQQQEEDMVMAYSALGNVEWKVMLIEPESLYQQPIRDMSMMILATVVMLFIMVSFILIMLVNKITAPVMKLAEVMEKMDGLGEKVAVVESNVEEIEVFQATFQRLLGRIEESAGKLVLAKETELNLRIMALQAQVNPHFLFNSLTAISAVAQEEQSQKVPLMCYQLSELFRYSSGGQNTVTLEEEMNHIRVYLEFLKWRYETNFGFEIETEGNLSEIKIPKLTLQPFVENTFAHAFKTSFPPYQEKIRCSVTEEGWSFYIADNGGGFDSERLQLIQKKMQEIDHVMSIHENYEMLETHDMAILNIYIRLKLLYRRGIIMEIGRDHELGGAGIRLVVQGEETNVSMRYKCEENRLQAEKDTEVNGGNDV